MTMTRAERRHHVVRVGQNRRKLALAKGHSHLADASLFRLAERHPLDCGKRCLMCHGEKLLESGSRRQRQKREALAEALLSA